MSALLLAVAVAVAAWPGHAENADKVLVLTIDGPIVPVVERYLDRGIQAAEEGGYRACIVELNTPGGLYETTQDIVQRILGAGVPVVVYVSPAGGWAASAGTFITLSAHVAAMAPGSRMGAAHPVGGQGEEIQGAPGEKIREDAAAWARSLAELRGRDPARAEAAVLQSKSYTDSEALKFNLVEYRASDLKALLQAMDGREVKLADGQVLILRTAEASIERREAGTVECILLTVSNPNIAYLLLSLGMLGILVEIFNPGMLFPGIVGVISLFFSLYALGTLEASWSGIILIILAFAFFATELFVASYGLLTAAGIGSLIAGSLLLFSESSPLPGINWSLIAGVAVSFTAFFAFALRAVVKAQKKPAETGLEGLRQATGVVLTPLNPRGEILLEGERWQAVSEDGLIDHGEEVRIERIEGLKAYVKRK
ncbi:MAG: NfeD family protein [Bacillota bacterium]